jgi:hypothetical protein
MFLLFSFVLFFTACEKDADFATIATLSSDRIAQNLSVAQESPLTLDYCVDVSTSHALQGFGTFKLYRQTGPRENNTVSRLESGLFTLEASGKGTSQELGNSTTEMKVEFNSRTNRLFGTIVTTFDSGETLLQKIDSDALVVFESRAMIIKANIRGAILQMPTENLDIIRGELILGLPIHPEGFFEANLYTTGMYCTVARQ